MTVMIDPHFNGPPDSGHGGYSAGRAAALLDGGGAVEVTLRRPVPLGVDMTPSGGGAIVELSEPEGGEVVMSARAAELDVVALQAPGPVDPEAAAAASARFAWLHESHPFPGCFGCGPDRDPADALCLFCGPVGDGRFAVPWTPAPWTGGDMVAAEFVWAALDCPSSAPAHRPDAGPIVLGRLTLAIAEPVAVGAPHVIVSWLERSEGRKWLTGAALYSAGGDRLAAARAVWIELAA